VTPDEAIACCRHHTNNLRAVFVFEHGTCVITDDEAVAKKYLAAFDVPVDGEGTPLGDIWPLELNDGSVCFLYSSGESGAICWTPMSQADLAVDVGLVPDSKTEFAQTDAVENDPNLLRHGRFARVNRGKDARGLNVVASWLPGSGG
jgi:hypothetical protein